MKSISFLFSLAVVLLCACGKGIKVANPRCCNLSAPIGIDEPSFSWQLADNSIGAVQTAYELQIASSPELLKKGTPDVWESGLQRTDEQLHIKPEGVELKEATTYWWRVRLTNQEGKQTDWSKPMSFATGFPSWAVNTEHWIAPDWSTCQTQPYLRRVFSLKQKPKRALAYVCTLGCGDLWINGNRVDETAILNPAQTNYEQYALYVGYDVTSRLKSGDNCIGAMLGDGWYHQNRVWGTTLGDYGHPKMKCALVVEYADGERFTLYSDEQWTWHEGPALSSNIYAGETYDARREIDNWCQPGQSSDGWQSVVQTSENVPPVLRPQMMEPIRLLKAVKPVKSWQANGKWILDFGINFAAVPRLNIDLPAGTTLTMRMGEVLNGDSIDFITTGVSATGVIQTDIYTSKGGRQTWTPRFTYHGFRYLELSGLDELPKGDFIEVVQVNTDLQQLADFTCSDTLLNRMHEMAIRTFLSNSHGIPTDCPHRERCGWLGDAHAVCPFESINYDMENFFMKYLGDVHSSASYPVENTLFHHLYNTIFYFTDKPEGLCFMIAPGRRQCGVASPDWGTAQIHIPWCLWWYYGNKEALAMMYDYMKVWEQHISALSANHIVHTGLGDWCPCANEGQPHPACPIPLSSTAFHYRDLAELEQIAQVLGFPDDAREYAEKRKVVGEVLVDSFYCDSTHSFGSQTADAMALEFGFAPEADREAIAGAIVARAHAEHHDFFNVGIFGLGNIGQALSRNGHAADAFRLFTKKGEYSFDWMITQADATTCWETLPVCRNSMESTLKGASLNHPMQAVYDQYFIEDIAGIRPLAPAFKKMLFTTAAETDLEHAEASIQTPYGLASSRWSKKGEVLTWHITIPANTTAEIALPTHQELHISPQIDLEEEDGRIIMPAGQYKLEIR